MSEHLMTEAEAVEEALLLITRKMRRMAPEAFDRAWGQLPDPAKNALVMAEARADRLRLTNTVAWPELDEED